MILEVKDLSYRYKTGRTIFHDVSFGIQEGEILSILGPNGAGKSTLLNCIANLLRPQSGQILLEGVPMERMGVEEIARVVGYVPQSHHPAYDYTVRDFVVMGRAPYIGLFSKPSQEDYDMAEEALERLGIQRLAHKPYTQISGGERQQVTIARVLVQRPKLILLDEPTSHLDYGNQIRTVNMIRRLSEEGFALILTTHTPDHVIMLGSRVGMLDYDGGMTFGSVEETMTEERLSRMYKLPLKVRYIEEIHRKACFAPNLD